MSTATKAGQVDRKGRREVARYVQLAETFRRYIVQGDWAVDMRLPTVATLALKHGVAKVTVRQAMDILDKEKLVARSPGRGMYVIDRPVQMRWHNLTADWDEFLRSAKGASCILAKSPRVEVPEDANVPRPIAEEFGFLRILGTRNEAPVSIRDVYVTDRLYQSVSARAETENVMAIFADYAHEIFIYNEIQAATPDQAEALAIPPGTPVLVGRHIGLDGEGELLFLDYPVLRGDYINFQIHLKRDAET